MSSGEKRSQEEYLYIEAARSEVPSLLDSVLNLTEQAASGQVSDEVRQLATVVQNAREESVTRDGLVLLVTEALRGYARESHLSEQTWKNLSVRVANVLFDDPNGRERLDRLWQLLGEVQV